MGSPQISREDALEAALQLQSGGLSQRRISRQLQLPRSTLRDMLRRHEESVGGPGAAPLSSPLKRSVHGAQRSSSGIDWQAIHLRLQGEPGATRLKIWSEMRGGPPEVGSYSSFCARYRVWLNRSAQVRLNCRAGDWMLVDCRDYPDRSSGRRVALFVAALGFSQYLYGQALEEYSLECWVDAHLRAFRFFQGVPRAVIVLRLQPWATNPGWPRQELNPTYEAMARQVGTVILPPATFQPKPARAVEALRQSMRRLAEASLDGRVRAGGDISDTLPAALDRVNQEPLPGLTTFRQAVFHRWERQALGPLPPRIAGLS